MATSQTSLSERQSDELEAIKAIYLEDVIELSQQNNKSMPLSYSIKLTPQRGASFDLNEEVQGTLRMNVLIPPDYPNVVPQISFVDVQGLSKSQVKVLEDGLSQMAKDSVGEVMILPLAQYVEAFLYANQRRPTPSFYDEMLLRRKREEEEVTKAQQKFQEKEVQAMRHEIQRRHEELREENLNRRNSRRLNSENLYEEAAQDEIQTPVLVNDKGPKTRKDNLEPPPTDMDRCVSHVTVNVN